MLYAVECPVPPHAGHSIWLTPPQTPLVLVSFPQLTQRHVTFELLPVKAFGFDAMASRGIICPQ
jgi:hypothetical protein